MIRPATVSDLQQNWTRHLATPVLPVTLLPSPSAQAPRHLPPTGGPNWTGDTQRSLSRFQAVASGIDGTDQTL